ncbi:RNA polymerase sigma factor [Raoultibacter phocaeensis]|uniref:RNA polymerase sigma factor n=1 Tax=Raoultibacter phocaeensis TaxID=2479841 RepID=UPI00111B11A1|nr:sigma-70 family RNA polymerase sigma factor [Raoultibacter phocaeensis]
MDQSDCGNTGSAEAARFAELHYDDVFRYCYRHIGSREDAQDLTQETFLRFVRSGSRYTERGKPLAYLYTIARNLCADRHRMQKPGTVELDERIADPHVESEGFELAEMISRLPETDKEIIALKYDQGLSIIEIAALLGLSRFAVSRKLAKALAALKRWIEDAEQNRE